MLSRKWTREILMELEAGPRVARAVSCPLLDTSIALYSSGLAGPGTMVATSSMASMCRIVAVATWLTKLHPRIGI